VFAKFVDYVSAPCSRSVKAMGYLDEVVGIRARYLRCRSHWANHLEQSRATILAGARRAPQRRKAVILGAGLLHDLPLLELSEMFHEVILVDLVHPLSSRWKTRRFKNIKRVSADVTESIASLYAVADDPKQALVAVPPEAFLNDPEVDFTASVNLLSQLPCMPMAYLKKRGAHSLTAIDNLARDLINAHLQYLNRLPGCVSLITDVERLKITLMNKIVEHRDLLFGLRLAKTGEEWEWRLAPCPEADRNHHYYRRVVGIADWK
jgi:hypothetical protein